MGWFVHMNGQGSGPYADADMVQMVAAGQVNETAHVCLEGTQTWLPVAQSPFASKPLASKPEPSVSARRVAIGVVVALGLLFGLLLLALKLSEKTSTPAVASAKAMPSPQIIEPPRPPTLAERLASADSLNSALLVLGPHFADSETELDSAGAGLALWAARRPIWWAMQALPETTRARVMKDSGPERGKRLCTSGTVVQIKADASGGEKVFEGLLMTNSMDAVRFVAVGSTDDILENSVARFCGVAIGRHSFPNVSGGQTLAVLAVGMFDLPQNKVSGTAR